MDKIIGVVGGLPASKSRKDDDFSDRLGYRYSTSILILFAIIVSTKQYVGEPIQCWVPAHCTENHGEYINNYCWIRNTYYLPFEDYVPKENEGHKRVMIPYYQWMPMILLTQALLFYMPIVVWRTLNGRAGINVSNIVESGESFSSTEMMESREKTLRYMTKQMDRYLSSQRSILTACTLSLKNLLSRTLCLLCSHQRGNYLTTLYFLIKLLTLFNILIQLFTLNWFLGYDFHLYGIEVFRSIARGDDWTESSRFPRVTMCDFRVRRLGNIQRYTVQCVLPINLFNEKIYLFIWFWMVFVATMVCFSLLTWILRASFRVDRHRYINKYLQLLGKMGEDAEKKEAVMFVEKYLKQDGVFVLRLVGHNTNAITVTEFVGSLWDNFRNKSMIEKDLSDGGDM